LPVLGGTEDALVEETVLLRLEGAVVDRLRLGDLSRRPACDLIWRGEADADRVEVVDFQHGWLTAPAADAASGADRQGWPGPRPEKHRGRGGGAAPPARLAPV